MNGYSLEDLEAFCARFYEGYDLLIRPYGYTATFLAIAQGITQTQALNVAGNADFIMCWLNHHANVGANVGFSVSTKTAPFLRLLITDEGSAEQFTAQAVDLENYSNNGVNPKSLPYPRIIAGRTSLSLALTNYAPAAEMYGIVDLFLSGVSVRAYQGGTGPKGTLRVPQSVQ